MARATYLPESFGSEIVAPSGYYQPIEEAVVDHDGRRLLYVLGSACIDASCCGIGSWQYARVEGYLVESDRPRGEDDRDRTEIDTIEDDSDRRAIIRLLLDKHPGVRIEFR